MWAFMDTDGMRNPTLTAMRAGLTEEPTVIVICFQPTREWYDLSLLRDGTTIRRWTAATRIRSLSQSYDHMDLKSDLLETVSSILQHCRKENRTSAFDSLLLCEWVHDPYDTHLMLLHPLARNLGINVVNAYLIRKSGSAIKHTEYRELN